MTEQELKDGISAIGRKFLPQLQVDEREVEIFHSDGYGELSNRSWLFCVKGSPNKLLGFVVRTQGCDNRPPWEFETNYGKFFYHEGVVKKKNWFINTDSKCRDWRKK